MKDRRNFRQWTMWLILAFIAVILLGLLGEALSSDEVDVLCNQNNSVLMKLNGTWTCGFKAQNYSCPIGQAIQEAGENFTTCVAIGGVNATPSYTYNGTQINFSLYTIETTLASWNNASAPNYAINLSAINFTTETLASTLRGWTNYTGTVMSVQGASGLNNDIITTTGTLSVNYSTLDARYLNGLLRLYFYNTTHTSYPTFTVMNSTVPTTTMRKLFTALPNGEQSLANRTFVFNLTSIPPGLYRHHTTINVTAMVIKTFTIHSILTLRNATGQERIIGTSTNSEEMIVGFNDVDFTGSIPTDVIFQPDEYLVMRLNATISGVGGVSPTFELIVGGSTAASIEIGAGNAFQALDEARINTLESQMLSVSNNQTQINFSLYTIETTLASWFNVTKIVVDSKLNQTTSGNISITGNVTIGQGFRFCLNLGCTRYIADNGTATVIV